MIEFAYMAYILYAILGVCVVSFAIMLLPPIFFSVREAISEWFDALFNEGQLNQIVETFLNERLHPFILDIREHHEFLKQEKGRHAFDKEFEEFFETAVKELREVNEGRRSPVSING